MRLSGFKESSNRHPSGEVGPATAGGSEAGAHIFVERRPGRLRLYLGGDLQFDERDERLYHEPLALVPVALAAARAPGQALRILILGGGDGLALREALRFPEVSEVHLVDRDPEVLRLGETVFAELNRGAFRDPRLRLQVADARGVLDGARGFDAVLYDLTYPGDVDGASLLSVGTLRKVRAALRGDGVVAVNAVSPERTPQAFGCIGRTLAAAGLWATPYAVSVPAFVEEGYGRWGFFFASPRAIGVDELRALRFPAGTQLQPSAVAGGTFFPRAAAGLFQVAENRDDELVYYLYNATPIGWEPPFAPRRFAPTERGRGAPAVVGRGFARWLRAPEGRRTLDELLRFLPVRDRDQTRASLLAWSAQAELLLRQLDLGAFVERALRRARSLPAAWVRELRLLRGRLGGRRRPFAELAVHAYRVFAIFLLVLVLADLFFPDNLYAKGFSSSSSSSRSSSSSSSSSGEPFYGFNFTDPRARFEAHRRLAFRGGVAAGPGPAARVYDSRGVGYPVVVVPRGARAPLAPPPAGVPVAALSSAVGLLALAPTLQLLDSGQVAYVPPATPASAVGAAGPPDEYHFVIEPGRLQVLDARGQAVLALLPTVELTSEVRTQILAQGSLVDKAMADHGRWLAWVDYAKAIPPGRQPMSEMRELERIKQVVGTAQAAWQSPSPIPVAPPEPGWAAVFPGVYLDWTSPARVGVVEGRWVALEPRVYPTPPRAIHEAPTVVLVAPSGERRARLLVPTEELTAEDRFLFYLFSRLLVGQVVRRPQIERWLETHRAVLARPAVPRS